MNIHTQISVDQNIIEVDDVHAQVEELEDEQQTYLDELEELREQLNDLTSIHDDEDETIDLTSEQLAKLESDIADVAETLAKAEHYFDQWEQDEGAYLDSLRELAAQLNGYDGGTLINESHFEDYARDYAESTGLVHDTMSWPVNCIDWSQAAHDLSTNFTAIEWENTTFYIDE